MFTNDEDERDAVYQPFLTAREEAIAIIEEEANAYNKLAYRTTYEPVTQSRLAVARELRKIATDAQADDDEAPGAERITKE